jgi:hypothetical protein
MPGTVGDAAPGRAGQQQYPGDLSLQGGAGENPGFVRSRRAGSDALHRQQ